MRREIIGFFIIKQLKNLNCALFCCNLGSGRALKKSTQKVGKTLDYTSFLLYRFLRALQQHRAQSRLLYLPIRSDENLIIIIIITIIIIIIIITITIMIMITITMIISVRAH